MIPRSRGSLFKDQSFGESDNAGTKAFNSHAGGALHAKEEVGWGGGAHREWYSVGETRRHQEKGAMLTAANMHVAKKSMSTLFRNACCIIDMHVA